MYGGGGARCTGQVRASFHIKMKHIEARLRQVYYTSICACMYVSITSEANVLANGSDAWLDWFEFFINLLTGQDSFYNHVFHRDLITWLVRDTNSSVIIALGIKHVSHILRAIVNLHQLLAMEAMTYKETDSPRFARIGICSEKYLICVL